MGFVALAFVVVLAFILGVYWLFVVRPEAQLQEAFWKRLKRSAPDEKVGATLLKRMKQLSSVPTFDAILTRSKSRIEPIELLIDRSGVQMTVGTFLLASAVCALVAWFVAHQMTGILLVSLPAAALAALVPRSVLKVMGTRRVQKLEEQFPEALALIARALRAGHTFTTGLAMVGEEMPAPIGPEFKLLYDQQNYGMPLPDALRDFGRRVPLLDARFFVTAVLIQRESGGNLAEVLDNIATVIRDRFRVKRQIRVISAHARMTGWVLIGVPPGLAFALFLITPEHWETLTGSQLGMNLIMSAIVLQILGTLTIRQLIRIEY